MLVTFSTNSYSDITLFGDIALTLLKMMEHSTTIPGAILAADVPMALSRLTSAINAEKTSPTYTDNNKDELEFSLAHRSLPLINLLTAAVKENSNVMWK